MKKCFLYIVFVLLATLGAQTVFAQVLDKKQADELVLEGEYIKALEIYKAINTRKSTLESLLDVARTYNNLRNYGEAEGYYRLVIKDANAPADAYLDLGDALMYNGKYEEARQMFFTYAQKGGDPTAARIRIFSCDSAKSIAERPPLFTIENERRINTKYSDFSAACFNEFIIFTSDRPIDYKPNDQEEMAVTLSTLQGVKDDVATMLLLRNAQDPTDITKFNTKSPDTFKIYHSIFDGAGYDVLLTEKDKKRERKRVAKERAQQEKLKEKKKRIFGGTGRPYLNIYASSNQNIKDVAKGVLGTYVWTAPSLLQQPLNSGDHSGPACFTPDGNTMYFCFSDHIVESQGGESYGTSHVGILISHKNGDGSWSEPIPFPYNKRSEYSVAHPCITKDGRYIIFSSNMPGTLGGFDLFMCELGIDGQWQAPVNLGPVINTPRNEQFPTLDNDGNLHFSSDGHPGLGGMDIFKAIGNFKEWTSIENMRQPINSSADDFSMVYLPGSTIEGLFSSNRSGGYGGDDIYSFRAIPQAADDPNLKGKPLVTVTAVNRKDNKPVQNVALTLVDTKSKNKRGSVANTDAFGIANFVARQNTVYSLSSSIAGYMPAEIGGIQSKKIKPGESIKITLPLDPIEEGSKFDVKNVYYDYGKATLKKAAYKELDKVVKFMKQNPNVRVELSSHTDSRGSLKTNMALSQKRAVSCVNYLVKKGIPKSRIVPKGYGPLHPVVRNAKTEKQHAKNRRTEIKILKVLEDSSKPNPPATPPVATDSVGTTTSPATVAPESKKEEPKPKAKSTQKKKR